MPTRELLTLVLAGGKGERLWPLTDQRAKPAVPFGGVYRIIDFTLSNCVNSGLRQVVVLTQYKSFSLHRHITIGWGMLSRQLGEFVEVMPPQQNMGEDWYLGTADAIYQNSYYVHRFDARRVLILSGDHIYKMDYRKMLALHDGRRADATLSALEVAKDQARHFGVVEVDEVGRVTAFHEKVADPPEIPGKPGKCLANMGVYCFESKLLLERLEADHRNTGSSHDFGKDVLPAMVKDGVRVFAYPFVDEEGHGQYWRDVGSLESYFEAQMDLVSVSPQCNLYDLAWPIRTHTLPSPPAKFVFAQDVPGGRRGVAFDSIVSPGTIISGGEVRRSVLSPWVRVNSFAEVEDCVIFENVKIGRRARLRRCIIDKDVEIPADTVIGHREADDRARYHVGPGGLVVIAKPRGILGKTPGFSTEF